MFINIPLSHSVDYYCEKIDTHIKEDFETKIPDYGAEAFNPIGFHFKRRNNRISGIYRSKNAKNAFFGKNEGGSRRKVHPFRFSLSPAFSGVYSPCDADLSPSSYEKLYRHLHIRVVFCRCFHLFPGRDRKAFTPREEGIYKIL